MDHSCLLQSNLSAVSCKEELIDHQSKFHYDVEVYRDRTFYHLLYHVAGLISIVHGREILLLDSSEFVPSQAAIRQYDVYSVGAPSSLVLPDQAVLHLDRAVVQANHPPMGQDCIHGHGHKYSGPDSVHVRHFAFFSLLVHFL